MRVRAGWSVVCCMWLTAAQAAEPGTHNKKRAGEVAPVNGVKTPGIQIPFASLKAEMEWEGAPGAWLGIANNTVFAPGAEALTRIDARAKEKKPGEAINGIKQPCGGAVNAFGSLWTGSCGAGGLARIDSKTWKPIATVASGIGPARIAIAATADSVWALTDARGTLSRIDPQTNEVVAEFRVFADCGSLTFGESALWLACPAENKVLRVDSATNVVDKSIETSGAPEAIAIGEGSVWVWCAKEGKVERIDPKANKVSKTIETGAPATGGTMAVGEGSVWVSTPGFPLTRIDPGTDKVAQQFYGKGAGAVQTSSGAVWLLEKESGRLMKFDPRRIAATLAE